MSKQRVPAEAFPPGDYIREELEERGWTPEHFADMLKWNRGTLDAILAGSSPITAEQARVIGNGFGTSATFWLNLETIYRRWRSRVYFEATSQQQPEDAAPPAEEAAALRYGTHYDAIPHGNCYDQERCDCECSGCPGVRAEKAATGQHWPGDAAPGEGDDATS